MTSILSFIERRHFGSFDPEMLRVMGEAYDAACKSFVAPTLHTRETIADRIIDAATRGERNPTLLLEAALRLPQK